MVVAKNYFRWGVGWKPVERVLSQIIWFLRLTNPILIDHILSGEIEVCITCLQTTSSTKIHNFLIHYLREPAI